MVRSPKESAEVGAGTEIRASLNTKPADVPPSKAQKPGWVTVQPGGPSGDSRGLLEARFVGGWHFRGRRSNAGVISQTDIGALALVVVYA